MHQAYVSVIERREDNRLPQIRILKIMWGRGSGGMPKIIWDYRQNQVVRKPLPLL